MNEIWGIATAFGLDYDTVAEMVKLDPRIGKSHMQVPGPDGLFGFGGACFPKDTKAFSAFAKYTDRPMELIEKTIEVNKRIRMPK